MHQAPHRCVLAAERAIFSGHPPGDLSEADKSAWEPIKSQATAAWTWEYLQESRLLLAIVLAWQRDGWLPWQPPASGQPSLRVAVGRLAESGAAIGAGPVCVGVGDNLYIVMLFRVWRVIYMNLLLMLLAIGAMAGMWSGTVCGGVARNWYMLFDLCAVFGGNLCI